MKKLISFFTVILFLSITNTNAQDYFRMESFTILQQTAIQKQLQFQLSQSELIEIEQHVLQSQVNQKDGFFAEVDTVNGNLTLTIAKKYDENDLRELLRYIGIEATKGELVKIKDALEE